ncbi:MAG: universal stress protein [Planctomycetes bacterium]|nr:universal stress protein [Planctomycetota bacterium]
MKIDKILVAMDFSETSEAALAYAKELAVSLGASLHVAHVEDDPILNAETTDQSYRDEYAAKATLQMESLFDPQERTRLRAEFVVLKGDAIVEIVRYARQQEMGMIVMGTHGRTALAHMILGSVAENVVRTASCPVLTVRHPKHRFQAP